MKKITKNGDYNNFNFSKINDVIKINGLKNVKAGQMVSCIVKISIKAPEIKRGDGICLGVPLGASLPQLEFPQKEGYTTFSSNTNAKLSIKIHPEKERFIQIIVEDGILKSGEIIKVCFGDKSYGGPGTQVPYQSAKDVLVPYLRIKDNKLSYKSPRINIIHQNFNQLRCYVSPTFRKNNSVKLTLIAEDEYGNRCKNFTGHIKITNRNISNKLPYKLIITQADKGKKQIYFIPKDINNFRVCCRYKDTYILSNACVKLNDSFPYNLYFGEIHAHSELSHDASGSVEELFKFAKNTAVLDFAAAADHQVGIKNLKGYSTHPSSLPVFDMEDMPFRWKLTCDTAKKYNKDGKFVTFPGFEFAPSGLSGHRNIYFMEDYPDMVNAPHNWNEKEDIINPFVREHNVLVIPHHPPIMWNAYINNKGKGLVFSDVEGKYQPVVEIYSKHGNSEYAGAPRPLRGQIPGYFVRDMLKEGHKFGFIAGSDTHQGNPGSSMINAGPHSTLQYRNGLAAVWAKDLTRESLWEAIFARRTYATSYNKTVLFFYINNLFMGEEGTISGVRQISLKVFSAKRIVKIEIIKNNEVIFAYNKNAPFADIDLKYEDKEHSYSPEDFYYARVIETEGDMVWSSPIWIKEY